MCTHCYVVKVHSRSCTAFGRLVLGLAAFLLWLYVNIHSFICQHIFDWNVAQINKCSFVHIATYVLMCINIYLYMMFPGLRRLSVSLYFPLFCVLLHFSCLVVCLYGLRYRVLYGVYLRSNGICYISATEWSHSDTVSVTPPHCPQSKITCPWAANTCAIFVFLYILSVKISRYCYKCDILPCIYS